MLYYSTHNVFQLLVVGGVSGFLDNGLEEERVFGESLHRNDEEVSQFPPLAHRVGLTPLGREGGCEGVRG